MKKIIFFILNNLFVFSLAIADDDATRDKPNDKKTGGDQNPVALEDVYVTGSNIKKSKTDNPGALRVIDADEIERSGAKSIKELFKKIPGNFQGVDEDSLESFAPGAAGLNWRGLGGQSVLLLINGRRVVNHAQPNALESFADVNSIPFQAIDKIEILREGASAIYGADAITGVINFILKKNFTEKSITITGGQSSYGDLQTLSSTATWGKGSLSSDHYNVYAIVEARKASPFVFGSRGSYLGEVNYEPWGYRDYSLPSGGGGTLSSSQFALTPEGEPSIYNEMTPLGNCPVALRNASKTYPGFIGSYCPGNFKSTLQTAKTEHVGITSVFTYKPNSDTTLFSELMLSQNNSALQGNPEVYVGHLPLTHPQFKGIGTTDFPTTIISNLLGLESTYSARVDFTRLVFGAEYFVGDWATESSFVFNRSKSSSSLSSRVLADKLDEAVQSGIWIFGDEANNRALLPSISSGNASQYQTETITFETKLSGNLIQIPTGTVKSAMGMEFRRESISTDSDINASSGRYITNIVERSSFDNSRNVASVYGELSIPVFSKIEAQVALRHDEYSSNVAATSPRMGMVWNPTPNWRFRGSIATGFRPPNLVESSDSTGGLKSNTVIDPQRCGEFINDGCQSSMPLFIKPNKALKPESSESWVLGLDWSPKDDTTVMVDYWRIKRKDGIGFYNPNRVLANPGKFKNDPGINIVRDELSSLEEVLGASAGKISQISIAPVNLANNDLSGIDLSISTAYNFGEYGSVTALLNYTRNLTFESALFPGDPMEDLVGSSAHPQDKASLDLQWTKGPWAISTGVQFIGKMSNRESFQRTCEPELLGYSGLCGDIAPFVTVNTGFQYTGYRGWKIGGKIENLFDEKPPFVANILGFNPLHSILGRYITLQATYTF